MVVVNGLLLKLYELSEIEEKGEEAFRRLSEHVARGIVELMTVPVEVHSREIVDQVL